MAADRRTFERFLEEVELADSASSADLRVLLLGLATACKAIGQRLADRSLRSVDRPAIRMGDGGNEVWCSPAGRSPAGRSPAGRSPAGRSPASTAGKPSSDAPQDFGSAACGLHRGRHLAMLLPVDSPFNINVNAGGGTIFSVLAADNDAPQSASRLVCAGYALHGPSLVLVLALGAGVQAFVLDRPNDEFVLTQADIRIPGSTDEIAVDVSAMHSWPPAIRRYVDECLAGELGPRGRDFRFHWLGSIVAETHRILMRGGVFVFPGTGRMTTRPRLLEAANPLSYVIERAGGRASTGTSRLLDAAAKGSRLQGSLVFGAVEEVERIESYHTDHEQGRRDTPLFAERGLFRSSV